MGYYTKHVFCCTNERPPGHERGCCKSKGSEKLQNYMKSRVKELGIENMRINKAGCLDRCELGSVFVVYPDEVWYHVETPGDVDEIIESHLKNGKPVERLRLKDDQKVL